MVKNWLKFKNFLVKNNLSVILITTKTLINITTNSFNLIKSKPQIEF